MTKTTTYTKVSRVAFRFDWHEVVAILEANIREQEGSGLVPDLRGFKVGDVTGTVVGVCDDPTAEGEWLDAPRSVTVAFVNREEVETAACPPSDLLTPPKKEFPVVPEWAGSEDFPGDDFADVPSPLSPREQ
jgi:hypothetical protein